jgi:hypothetical protein
MSATALRHRGAERLERVLLGRHDLDRDIGAHAAGVARGEQGELVGGNGQTAPGGTTNATLEL